MEYFYFIFWILLLVLFFSTLLIYNQYSKKTWDNINVCKQIIIIIIIYLE